MFTLRLKNQFDIAIVGAGLAGLSLARQLLLQTGKTVLLIDRKKEPSKGHQKVGESLVQLSGYYFSKVLDLEEYLLRNHYLKFNLRFYWKTAGRENTGFEDYSKSYSRKISDIANFQLDRNKIEQHLLAVNSENPRFQFAGGVKKTEVELAEDGDHTVTIDGETVRCRWVVDCSGRGSLLKKQLGLQLANPIHHGSTWCWVEGLVDIEKITGRSWGEIRKDPQRQKAGHFPAFLATNHFCDQGQWFWVIPLHGITSLGLVFEHASVDPKLVPNAKALIEYACRNWPMFARDLPNRKIVDEGRFVTYSYDAKQTISPGRWALSGMAGRFTDPLYSPGSDLIATYNTLIIDAIEGPESELPERCRQAETLMRALSEAYVPSYAVSYNCLGDQECFSLKYGWELAVYFGFYVFAFVNDLFTNPRFVPEFLRKFGLLGPLNRNLHQFLSDYYVWKKKSNARPHAQPHLNDFLDLIPVAASERMFYEVGLPVEQALEALDGQYQRMREFARFIVAYVASQVAGDPAALRNAAFVRALKPRTLQFDPESLAKLYCEHRASAEIHAWSFDASQVARTLPPDVVSPIDPRLAGEMAAAV
jgi:2-polyprenyl-6-methoxyphenol hydroxylase-like FAD-dependent oxidoreductase